MSSVAVILGAGASTDCVGGYWVEEVTPAAQPPLTAQIFDHTYGRFLGSYRDASVLVSTIKAQINNKRSLESVLRGFAQASQPQRRAQFLQIPLYLRDLFTWITDAYTANPPNYSRLAHELIDEFKRVIFVTMNYDGLLEKVLGVPSHGGPIRDLADYSRPNWLLAKLHGSVGWVRRSRNVMVPTNIGGNAADPRYLEALTSIVFAHQSVDDVFDHLVYPALRGGKMMDEGYLYYPALVIPVEGKYGFVCPPAIIAELEEALADCAHVLIVGASGRDADLTALLERRLPDVLTYHFVGMGDDVAVDAKRFAEAVPQLRSAPSPKVHGSGFSGFLRDDFSQFIEDVHLFAGE